MNYELTFYLIVNNKKEARERERERKKHKN